MKYKFKYLHVLFFDDTKFYTSLVKTINSKDVLKPDKHVFITDKENVYKEIAQYTNCHLINDDELLYYISNSRWIIFHAMPLKKWQVCLLPNSICNKIIWRTWGHDIRPWKKTNRFICDFLKYIEFLIFRNKVKKFYAIGIANEIDIVNIEEVYGSKFKYLKINYSDSAENYKLVRNIAPKNDSSTKYVLIGHNCSPVDNHLDILDKLSRYRNEDIHLIIPLSYSNPGNGYKEQIINKAYSIFGMDKVTILDKFVPKDEYVRLLSRIDVAIMDMYYSNGLGNISYILYFRKKLYVRHGSNMDKAFLREGIQPNYTSGILGQSFEEFTKNEFDDKYLKFCEELFDANAFENRWKEIMEECGE